MRRRRRRLLRILLNAATVVSLVLFLAIVGIWLRSYWTCDRVLWRGAIVPDADADRPGFLIRVNRGRVSFYWDGPIAAYPYSYTEERSWTHEAPSLDKPPSGKRWWNWLGVHYFNFSNRGFAMSGELLMVHLALPASVSALAPIARIAVRRLRRRNGRRGSSAGCVVCGYDLRATPDRCPECGAVPPPPLPPPPSA
jgi:hypothetical protein